jgi:hypothetical protein
MSRTFSSAVESPVILSVQTQSFASRGLQGLQGRDSAREVLTLVGDVALVPAR